MDKYFLNLHNELLHKKLDSPENMRASLGGGLCNNIDREHLHTLYLFKPLTVADYEYFPRCIGDLNVIFWASGIHDLNDAHKMMYDYTPLRQTIILLCAAINDEL